MIDESHRRGGERKPRPAAVAPPRHARLAGLAAPQWGAVARRQLRAVGFSDREVDGMLARGELQRMHRGVYAVGHVSPAPEARWAAAILAAGVGSGLSHTAALAVNGLIAPRHVTEVTAPTQRRGDETLRVHVRSLAPGEWTRVRGLPVVSISRTLQDVAATGWPIDRLTQQAVGANLVSLAALREYADAATGRGAGSLRAAVRAPVLRSGPERRLLAFLRGERLPIPVFNARIGRIRVDGLWRSLNLAVELDPEQTHGTAWAESVDAWRDRYVAARGIRLLRVEERDLPLLAAELRRLRAAAA